MVLQNAVGAFAQPQRQAPVRHGAPAGDLRGQGLAVQVPQRVGFTNLRPLSERQTESHGEGVGGDEPALDDLPQQQPRP